MYYILLLQDYYCSRLKHILTPQLNNYTKCAHGETRIREGDNKSFYVLN